MGKVELKAILFEKLTCLLGLNDTLRGQIDIMPASESVLEVPG